MGAANFVVYKNEQSDWPSAEDYMSRLNEGDQKRGLQVLFEHCSQQASLGFHDT